VCIQPCCHGTWLALGTSGYLYNLNMKTGALSRPRFTGITSHPSLQGGIGPLAYNKSTRKLYSFGQALSEGSTSYLYEISRTSGAATRIGQLKATTHYTGVAAHDVEEGVYGGYATFNPAGNTLYGGSDSGSSHTNASLMTIDVSTGTATKFGANYDNSSPLIVSSFAYGAAFHPINELMYCWRQDLASSNYYISLLSTSTGIASTGRALTRSSTGHVPFDMEMVKQPSGVVKAYAVGTALFVCNDIDAASPVLTKIADFTGMVGGSDGIVGLAKVP